MLSTFYPVEIVWENGLKWIRTILLLMMALAWVNWLAYSFIIYSGIGYILTLLNQCYFFESLNWFDSISAKYDQEIEQIREEQRLAQRRKDESYAQALTMKIGQIEDLQRVRLNQRVDVEIF